MAARLTLQWDMTDSTSATFSASHWDDSSDTQAAQAIAYNPDVFNPADEARALELFGTLFPEGTTGQQIAEAMFVVPGLSDHILTNPDAQDADWVRDDQPGVWPGTAYNNKRPPLATDSNMSAFTLRFDHEFSNALTLTSLTHYADLERNDTMARSGVPFELSVYNDFGTIETFSQEFRLVGETEKFQYIAGVFYSNDELVDNGANYVGQPSTVNQLRVLTSAGAAQAGASDAVVAELAGGFRSYGNNAEMESETIAAFGQIGFNLSETLSATIGVRYTEDDLSYLGCSRDNGGDGNVQVTWNAAFGTSVAPGECVTFVSDFSAPVANPGFDKELKDLVSDNNCNWIREKASW